MPALMQNMMFQQMLQQWQVQQNATTQAQGDTATKPEDLVGMSKTGLNKTTTMCGICKGDTESLPEWFKLCAEKGQMEETKDSIITQLL
eukprot:11586794-Ditylum_brightwellii.AAC.1